jgi:hypothetical protein
LNATAEHAVLVVAARHGLGEPNPPVALDAETAEEVLFCAGFDHLTGFLASAVHAGVVTCEEEGPVVSLQQQWQHELRTCLRLEALALRTAELLDEAGIRWRLTKGPALAHLDYPDPSVRTFGDVDVIIHPADWSAAFRLLSESGCRREAPTLPGGYDARYGKGATLTTAEGLEIDLHRRFAIGRFGVTARMETVFESSASVELAGRTIPVPDPVHRLLHACFHASLGGFRGLRAFRDVAQLILVTGANWEATFAVARSWEAEAVVSAAIKDTWTRLGLDVDHPAHVRAVCTRTSRLDDRVLGMFADEGSTFRAQALSALPRLPPHEVPRYLWSLGAPTLRRRS